MKIEILEDKLLAQIKDQNLHCGDWVIYKTEGYTSLAVLAQSDYGILSLIAIADKNDINPGLNDANRCKAPFKTEHSVYDLSDKDKEKLYKKTTSIGGTPEIIKVNVDIIVYVNDANKIGPLNV